MSNISNESQSTPDAASTDTASKKTSNASNDKEFSHRLQDNYARTFVGIRQYTNQLSPSLANSGYIARSRQIYDNIFPNLSKNYPGWYVVIEPDSGDYFLNTDKNIAKNEARQKHPKRLFCTFQVITSGAGVKNN